MKRGVFLFVVIAFAIFSLFVLYLDSTGNCGSVVCVAKYVSTGEVDSSQVELKNNVFSKIIYPFVNSVEDNILLQPGPLNPFIEQIVPSLIFNDTDNVVIVLGNDFASQFGIAIRVAGTSEWFTLCTFLDTACTFTDSTQVSFFVPSGYSTGNYEIEYVDISGPLSGTGPALESNNVTFIVQDPPTSPPIAPSNLIVLPLTSDSLQINWTDNSNDEQGFTLEYKQSLDSTWLPIPGATNLIPNTVTYTHTGLSPNTLYDYRIVSYNVIGNSPLSNIATGRTLHLTPTISSINPGLIYDNVGNIITVTGSNFIPQFAIAIRVQGQNWVEGQAPWCDYLSTSPAPDCNFIDSSTVSFEVPFGMAVPGNYEVAYVIADGSYPALISNIVPLVVEPGFSDPVINSINPNLVMNNIDRTLTLSGSNLHSDFVLLAQQVGPNAPFQYCNSLPTDTLCDWIDNSTLMVTIPQGASPGDFEFQFLSVYNGGTLILSSDFVPFSIQATACLDGLDTLPCSNQAGACSGAVAQCVDGIYETCTATNYESNNASYNANEIGLCSDGLDNDCDASGEFDYDGSGAVKGDNDCPVQVTGISAPSQVFVSSSFSLQCTSSVPDVRSVQGLVDGQLCSFSAWMGNQALFDCFSSSTPGTISEAECDINLLNSYQTGSALTSSVQILANSCSGYGSSSSCESDSSCDWLLGCSDTQSSGGADRCVLAGTGSYQCIINQCNAVCDGTVNGCSSSQSCSLSSCGCTEENPVINNINNLQELTFSWGSQNTLTINGQYFATDAQLLIDGVAVAQNRLTVVGNSIIFIRNSEEFAVGTHNITILNPTSGIYSNSLNMILTANPVISSIVPNVVLNNIYNIVNITGLDFDPNSTLTANGVDLTFLRTYVNSQLIQFLVPPNFAGDFSIVITSGDGISSSIPVNIRLNYPFDYVLELHPSNVTVAQGYSFDFDVVAISLPEMTQEEVVFTVADIPEATFSFVGPDRCIPSGGNPNPSCTVTINAVIGTVAEQNYSIVINATSEITGVVSQINLTLQGVIGLPSDCTNGIQESHESCVDGGGPICSPLGFLCGLGQSCSLNEDCVVNPLCSPPIGLCYSDGQNSVCHPDQDCDRVPDSIDLCPTTPTFTFVSSLNGCPVPAVTEFTPSLTTNFLSVLDLSSVQDMALGVSGVGRIQFLGQQVSVLRLILGVHQALNLDSAVMIVNNLIEIDALGNPELDQTAVLTFEGLNNLEAPTPLVSSPSGFVVCPSTQCQSLTWNSLSRVFTVRVAGFSSYSTQTASCGDTYCSLNESCSTCSTDCGACGSPPPSGGSGGGSGGGGGGGGGSSGGSRTVIVQCNDKVDNDGDGKIDYPSDKGCFNLQDNLEIDETPLIDNSNDEDVIAPLEKIFEIRIIFWLVLITLIGGIVLVSTIILREILGPGKFKSLVKTTPQKPTSPPVGI